MSNSNSLTINDVLTTISDEDLMRVFGASNGGDGSGGGAGWSGGVGGGGGGGSGGGSGGGRGASGGQAPPNVPSIPTEWIITGIEILLGRIGRR